MPIIDHNNVPEVHWRPGYRKWDVTLEEHGVSSSLSLNTAEPGTGAPRHTWLLYKSDAADDMQCGELVARRGE